MERFEEAWKTADAAAGVNCLVPTITRTSEKYKGLSNDEWIEAMKAICFFVKANKMRFGSKIREVSETVVLGVDNYPTTLDVAYRILTETQQRMNAGREASERRGAGTTTASAGTTIASAGTCNYQRRSIPDGQDVVMGTDRRVYNVQCNNCNAWGHYARECPRASSEVSNNSKNTNVLRDELKSILDTGSTHTTVKDNNDITYLKVKFYE